MSSTIIFCLVATVAAFPSQRLRIGEVKQCLARFGISTAGIVEADALRTLLLEQCPPEAAGAGHAVPLEKVTAADGAMGSGVDVYDKIYYSVRLELPAAGAA